MGRGGRKEEKVGRKGWKEGKVGRKGWKEEKVRRKGGRKYSAGVPRRSTAPRAVFSSQESANGLTHTRQTVIHGPTDIRDNSDNRVIVRERKERDYLQISAGKIKQK